MRWIPDNTGRFAQRPYYESAELDRECERIISRFLLDRHGKVLLPVPTDDLTVLIERETSVLDLYADLSGEGVQAQGVTDFFPGEKPRVQITRELSEQGCREHRLRTTLTHEYAHVRLHAPLYEAGPSPSLFEDFHKKPAPKCRRDTMLGAGTRDWLEWQAGYASGAILMPATHLGRIVEDTRIQLGIYGPARTNSSRGRALVCRVANAFDVSYHAARVRLQQLDYLVNGSCEPHTLIQFGS